MNKISVHQSNALTIAVFLNTILVMLRHSVNLHQYYKNGNHWMAPIDFNTAFQTFIARFTNVAIPFFFLISGFLFFNNIEHVCDWLNKIKKRFYTLLIPYLVWNILLTVICLALFSIPALAPQIRLTYGLEYSLSWIIANLTYKPIIGQFWYIRTLFIYMFFTPLYLYIFKSRICSILIVLFSFILWQLPDTSLLSIEGACFFLLGGVLSYHGSLPSPQPCNVWIWFFLLQIIILTTIIFSSMKYAFIQKICILIQIYTGWQICLFLASNIELCRFLVKMNHHSFFLYATHATILKALSLYSSRILPHFPYTSFGAYFLCFFLTLTLSLSISIFVQKTFPKIYLILTGGR